MNMQKNGFSLMELAVAMGIFTIIIYLVLTSTVSNRASSTLASATIFLNSQLRLAVSSVTGELMQAKSTTVFTEEPITGTNPQQYRKIRFKVPLVDSNGNLIPGVGGDTAFGANGQQDNFIRYALNGTNLERQIVNSTGSIVGTPRIIARNVSSFTVTYNSSANRYEINLGFSITSYTGIQLKPPLAFSTIFAINPRN